MTEQSQQSSKASVPDGQDCLSRSQRVIGAIQDHAKRTTPTRKRNSERSTLRLVPEPNSELAGIVDEATRELGKSMATPSADASDHRRCICGCRTLSLSEEFCDGCDARHRRASAWAKLGGHDLLDAAERIGVFAGFCHGDAPPTFADNGLGERIAVRPLPPGGLFVCGIPGTHKTHLLAARTCDAASRGYSARLINWRIFRLEVQATYGPAADETQFDVWRRYVRLDYLAIDDLGAGGDKRETDAARGLCYDLVNARYDRKRTTDVSSNLTLAELEDRFDAPLARRLRELTTEYPMLLPSFRDKVVSV